MQNFDNFNDAVLLAPIIQFQTMHLKYKMVTASGQSSALRFSADIRLQKRHTWCYYFWTTGMWDMWLKSLVALFSLNLFKMYAAKQTQNAAFTGLKSIARSQQQQSHSVPSFIHFKSLVCQKSCDWSAMLTAQRSELNYFSLHVIQKASKPLKDFLCWHTMHN